MIFGRGCGATRQTHDICESVVFHAAQLWPRTRKMRFAWNYMSMRASGHCSRPRATPLWRLLVAHGAVSSRVWREGYRSGAKTPWGRRVCAAGTKIRPRCAAMVWKPARVMLTVAKCMCDLLMGGASANGAVDAHSGRWTIAPNMKKCIAQDAQLTVRAAVVWLGWLQNCWKLISSSNAAIAEHSASTVAQRCHELHTSSI